MFSADVEIQWNELRTGTGADGHAASHNDRVRGRRPGRTPPAPSLGWPPPDVGQRRRRFTVAGLIGHRTSA